MERRSCQRFGVPGATADWVAQDKSGLQGQDCPLGDLARGGARLLCESPPRDGTVLRLRLSFPGDPEALEVRGRAVWRLLSTGRIYHLGVEFAPYGQAPGANDPAVLQRIIALEARFVRPGP